jgi:hypothetical protein
LGAKIWPARIVKKLSMRFAKLFACVGGLLLALSGRVMAQELVVNGSLENVSNTFVADGNESMSLQPGSTVIPGWTTTNAELLWLSNSNVFGATTPYGSFFLDLTGYHDSYPYGGITQTIPTTPGETYQVSFSLGQYQQKGIYSGPVSVTAVAGLSSDGSNTFTPTNGGGNEWGSFQVNFTAQCPSTMISITGSASQGGQYLGLDNVSLTAQGGGPALLINGSLEDTDGAFVDQSVGAMSLPVLSTNIPGWVTTTAEIAWVTNSTPLGYRTPYGSMFLDLTGFHDSIPYGGIEQTVATVPGQDYTLGFWVGVDQDYASSSGPATVVANIQPGSNYTTTATGGNWQSFSFTFVADAAETPLIFTGASTKGGQYIGLDNVSVTLAVPALLITSVATLGATNLILGFNSQLGNSYAVQSCADLASATWATLRGTTNSGNGGTVFVTLTNAITAAQQFYRIQQLN